MSVAVTVAPLLAMGTVNGPIPENMSKTRSPEHTWSVTLWRSVTRRGEKYTLDISTRNSNPYSL